MEKPNEIKDGLTVNKRRQILIETDGNSIEIVKAEVSSIIEFKAILSLVSDYINKQTIKQNVEAVKEEKKV
jgi:hypothetical protein